VCIIEYRVTNLLLKEIIMHSKRKGNIASFGVGLELTKLGYSVFTEEGDISKIDMIAEKDGEIIRLQVKGVTPVNNTLPLELTKSGPNYSFRYELGYFDYFALWDLENHVGYLISSEVLNINNKRFTLRLNEPKNNQNKHINKAEDYLLEKVLITSRV
jgi:hypothetical protein